VALEEVWRKQQLERMEQRLREETEKTLQFGEEAKAFAKIIQAVNKTNAELLVKKSCNTIARISIHS